jgi:hypothetical protein
MPQRAGKKTTLIHAMGALKTPALQAALPSNHFEECAKTGRLFVVEYY